LIEGIERQLRDSCSKRGRVEVRDTAYWWEQVVGNLSISVNEDVEDEGLLEELDELCNTIDSHLEMQNVRASRRSDA
jgi:hypothetical protein